jgi:ABC-2 type transport system permease protein
MPLVSTRRTLAILRKEFRHILRDLRLLFLVTVSPAILLLTLSNIFAFDVQQVDIAVWNLDRSPVSRQYLAALTADGDFYVEAQAASYADIDRWLMSGRVDLGLVIPRRFGAELQTGHPVEVQAILDGTEPLAANQTAFALRQRTMAFAAQFSAEPSRAGGGLDVRSEVWYNRSLESLLSMVPGLVAIVLCMPTLALALALTREKETGSFEALIATPVRGSEYLVGKLIAYVASGLASALLVWLVAVLYFRVPFRGSFPVYLLLAAIYLTASMGFSLIIANFVHTQQTAMFLVLVVFFIPSFFIAGLITPVETNTLGSRLVAYSLPATHFIAISRAVFLKGLGLTSLELKILPLLAMGAGGLLISLMLFRKRLR